MTAVLHPPARLLTVADYAALGETEHGYTELLEGRLLMSPSPTPDHSAAITELIVQLRPQLPGDVEAIADVDVDLALVPPDQPGFCRRPDVIVARRTARDRVRAQGGLIRADEVLLAVEVVSPGSRRTDYVVKRAEYADAGIPHYWIVDLQPPASLLSCRLAGEFGYRDTTEASGGFDATEPFDLHIELDTLI